MLVAAPLVYLLRIGKTQRFSLKSVNAAPPRRVGSLSSSTVVTSSAASRFTFAAPEQLAQVQNEKPLPQGADWDDDNWGVPPAPPDPNDNFNVAVYLLKALGTATLIVSSVAFVGIWGLRRYLDVDNVRCTRHGYECRVLTHLGWNGTDGRFCGGDAVGRYE